MIGRRASWRPPLAEAKLVFAGNDLLMVTDDADLVSIIQRPGQLVMVYDLATAVNAVHQNARRSRHAA